MNDSKIPFEKMHAIQSEIIRRQQQEIDSLRASNHVLEVTSQTLAQALSNALEKEGRDRIFVQVREIRLSSATFKTERTIDGDLILVRDSDKR